MKTINWIAVGILAVLVYASAKNLIMISLFLSTLVALLLLGTKYRRRASNCLQIGISISFLLSLLPVDVYLMEGNGWRVTWLPVYHGETRSRIVLREEQKSLLEGKDYLFETKSSWMVSTSIGLIFTYPSKVQKNDPQ